MFAIGKRWRTREDTGGIFAVPQWRGLIRRYPDGYHLVLPCSPHLRDILMDIFSSLPFPAGTVNTPENVGKNEVFSRAKGEAIIQATQKRKTKHTAKIK